MIWSSCFILKKNDTLYSYMQKTKYTQKSMKTDKITNIGKLNNVHLDWKISINTKR